MDIQELEVSQHQVNNQSTPSQQPEKSENVLNSENIDDTEVVEDKDSSQHQPDTQGERVSKESVEPKNVVQEELDYKEIIKETDIHIERLGWDKEQGREYLVKTYGKRSRQTLTDEELLEFLEYLRNECR